MNFNFLLILSLVTLLGTRNTLKINNKVIIFITFIILIIGVVYHTRVDFFQDATTTSTTCNTELQNKLGVIGEEIEENLKQHQTLNEIVEKIRDAEENVTSLYK